MCLNFARGNMGKLSISLGTSVVFFEKPGAGGAWICALNFVSGSPLNLLETDSAATGRRHNAHGVSPLRERHPLRLFVEDDHPCEITVIQHPAARKLSPH